MFMALNFLACCGIAAATVVAPAEDAAVGFVQREWREAVFQCLTRPPIFFQRPSANEVCSSTEPTRRLVMSIATHCTSQSQRESHIMLVVDTNCVIFFPASTQEFHILHGILELASRKNVRHGQTKQRRLRLTRMSFSCSLSIQPCKSVSLCSNINVSWCAIAACFCQLIFHCSPAHLRIWSGHFSKWNSLPLLRPPYLPSICS